MRTSIVWMVWIIILCSAGQQCCSSKLPNSKVNNYEWCSVAWAMARRVHIEIGSTWMSKLWIVFIVSCSLLGQRQPDRIQPSKPVFCLFSFWLSIGGFFVLFSIVNSNYDYVLLYVRRRVYNSRLAHSTKEQSYRQRMRSIIRQVYVRFTKGEWSICVNEHTDYGLLVCGTPSAQVSVIIICG